MVRKSIYSISSYKFLLMVIGVKCTSLLTPTQQSSLNWIQHGNTLHFNFFYEIRIYKWIQENSKELIQNIFCVWYLIFLRTKSSNNFTLDFVYKSWVLVLLSKINEKKANVYIYIKKESVTLWNKNYYSTTM